MWRTLHNNNIINKRNPTVCTCIHMTSPNGPHDNSLARLLSRWSSFIFSSCFVQFFFVAFVFVATAAFVQCYVPCLPCFCCFCSFCLFIVQEATLSVVSCRQSKSLHFAFVWFLFSLCVRISLNNKRTITSLSPSTTPPSSTTLIMKEAFRFSFVLL